MRTAAPSTPPSLAAGEVLDGRYRIIRSIARGSTGNVFLGEQTPTQRSVAIKLPHLAITRAVSKIVDYMTEAFAVGTLGHPNIVGVIDTGVARGRPYIVYEYLEGSSLAQEVQRSGGMPVARALDIALQIATALDAAHTAGIVHLELHTGNVMLTQRGVSNDHVRVLDFGCAHLVPGDRHRSLPPGLAIKAPELIAPEQIYTPSTNDPRTDIYALGCCLYEMLAGRRPFRSGPQHAALQRVLHEPPRPLERDIPRALRVALFDRMLAKEPSHRFASMCAAMDALDWVARGLPGAPLLHAVRAPQPAASPAARASAPPHDAPAADLPSPPRAYTSAEPPRQRAALVLGALLAIAIGSGAGYLYTQAERGTPVGAADDVAPAPDLTAAKQRARDIAASPVLHAALALDAPAALGVLATDATFRLRPGEVVEVYQRDSILLARVPNGSPPLDEAATDAPVDNRAGRAQVRVPVLGPAGAPVGALVLAMPLGLPEVTAER